ncbi:minor capsid protein [Streptomyces sp. NPDC046900]|uniref:minor capsid protein n=1 Tax=Streptomyces sp. NPDC046900 TaxID=3155473 RepID=UPI0033F26218
MADLLDGIARHLDGKGLLSYRPAAPGGDCFLESMPGTPDEVIVLTLYGGPEPDSRLGYDEPNLQVRGRGGQDPRVSRGRVQAIYDELHGLGPITLPDGTELILCVATQPGAASIGIDSSGRHEHVCNFRLETRSVTTHRV